VSSPVSGSEQSVIVKERDGTDYRRKAKKLTQSLPRNCPHVDIAVRARSIEIQRDPQWQGGLRRKGAISLGPSFQRKLKFAASKLSTDTLPYEPEWLGVNKLTMTWYGSYLRVLCRPLLETSINPNHHSPNQRVDALYDSSISATLVLFDYFDWQRYYLLIG